MINNCTAGLICWDTGIESFVTQLEIVPAVTSDPDDRAIWTVVAIVSVFRLSVLLSTQ